MNQGFNFDGKNVMPKVHCVSTPVQDKLFGDNPSELSLLQVDILKGPPNFEIHAIAMRQLVLEQPGSD